MKTYRNRKTGKVVTANESFGVIYYHSLRDGKRYGPVMGMSPKRFAELYEEVT